MTTSSLRHRFCRRPTRSRQRGVVAIVVGLTLAVMVGFIGLALDGGHLYLTKTELQNAADACALAASYELTNAPTIPAAAFLRAEAAGVKVGARNRVDYQGGAIPEGKITVQFGNSLSGGSWVAAAGAPPASLYVRCTIVKDDIPLLLMPALNAVFAAPQTVTALATATLAPAQSNCAVPMGLCVRGTGTNFGYVPGDWYGLDFKDTGSATASYTGNFRWVDFDPSSTTPGCSGGGAQELACIMRGTGQCSLPAPITGACTSTGSASPTPGCVGQNGNVASLEVAYNSRFGVYKGGGGNPSKTTAAPDFTGFSYAWEGATPVGNWSLGRDAYAGTSGSTPNFAAARAAHLSTTNVAGMNPDFYKTPYSNTTVADHTTYGADRRLVTAPIVECSSFTGGQHAPVRAYACILLLDPYRSNGSDVVSKFEYIGRSNVAGSPCATSGIAGNATSQGPMVPALVQ